MKKLLLSSLAFVALISAVSAQTTVYSEDFSPGSTWTLNTVTGAEGTYPNQWYISCQEDGQPAGQCGTACAIADNSLHVSANSLIGDLGAAYFEGLGCTTSRRASSGDINTTGFTGLTLSFDMIGNGGNPNDFTELFYSTNGGASWTSLASTLTSMCCGGVNCTGSLQGLWQNNTYSLPASCEGISNLRISFVWKNLDDGIATDPSFAVDDILITGTAGVTNDIATSTFSQAGWCYGTTINDVVDFTANGTYNAGNVFTAELSDASGSFAAPTAIGTLNSTASGTLSINVTIPGITVAGTAYRIRVVSSNPAIVGTDNGSDLTIHALPTVTLGNFSDVCVYTPTFTLTGGSPGGGTYTGPGVSGGTFNPATAGIGTHAITYNFTDGNNCSASANQSITVDACAGLQENEGNTFIIYPNPATESFVVEGIVEGDEIQLIDMNGRLIRSFEMSTESFSVEGVQNGTYFLRITRDKHITTQQLVINR